MLHREHFCYRPLTHAYSFQSACPLDRLTWFVVARTRKPPILRAACTCEYAPISVHAGRRCRSLQGDGARAADALLAVESTPLTRNRRLPLDPLRAAARRRGDVDTLAPAAAAKCFGKRCINRAIDAATMPTATTASCASRATNLEGSTARRESSIKSSVRFDGDGPTLRLRVTAPLLLLRVGSKFVAWLARGGVESLSLFETARHCGVRQLHRASNTSLSKCLQRLHTLEGIPLRVHHCRLLEPGSAVLECREGQRHHHGLRAEQVRAVGRAAASIPERYKSFRPIRAGAPLLVYCQHRASAVRLVDQSSVVGAASATCRQAAPAPLIPRARIRVLHHRLKKQRRQGAAKRRFRLLQAALAQSSS